MTAATESPTQDGLLSVEEVAALLAVPKRWVYDAARRGELPSGRLGKYLRFRRTDVVDFVNKRFDAVG